MGFFDFLTGGKKKAEPISIDSRTPQRQQVDAFLANFLNTYGSQYQPGKAYTGDFTAPLGGIEKQGIDQFLNQYLNQGVSSNVTDVQKLLNQTVTGGFDPGTSAYYQALRDASAYNRKQALNQTNADLGSRNKFFSSEAVAKTGDINAQTANALNLALADLANKERDRSLSAVAPALNLEDYLSKIPLQKATAATTIGAIPRQLEQSDLEARYQDFKRQQEELKGVVNAGSGVSNATITQGYANPTLQQDNGLTGFLSTILGSGAGQGALQSVGKGIASFLPMLLCWVAAEIFGGWEHPKTINCRYYIGYMAPEWFRNFYMKHGEKIADFIKDKPLFKLALRPLFELFAELGKNEREVSHGIA